MAQEYLYQGDGSTFECDGGHIGGVKRGFSVGIRCSVKRRSMYCVEYGIGFFNESVVVNHLFTTGRGRDRRSTGNNRKVATEPPIRTCQHIYYRCEYIQAAEEDRNGHKFGCLWPSSPAVLQES